MSEATETLVAVVAFTGLAAVFLVLWAFWLYACAEGRAWSARTVVPRLRLRGFNITLNKGVNLFRLTDVSYYKSAALHERPRWRRVWRLPRLYRQYRGAGVSPRVACQLCWNVLIIKVMPPPTFEWYQDVTFNEAPTIQIGATVTPAQRLLQRYAATPEGATRQEDVPVVIDPAKGRR